jgi:GTPase SAR1 family protein
MSDKEKAISEIEGFFKTRVFLRDLEGILNNAPSTLIGVDNVSNKSLRDNGVETLRDLANLTPSNPPDIVQIPPNILVKWINIAILIKKSILGQIKEEKKVLMVGLDNVGKTSLLNVMKRNFSTLRDILPTKGVQRETLHFFGYPIISWDLGGQVQFRENWYFEKPELYFSEANLMIYVIDVQDRSRFGEAGGYLNRILDILENLGEKTPVLIALNKSDPDVINTPTWEENVKYIGDLINPILEQYGFTYDYSLTSIFQTETVIHMFSNALKKFSETSEIIRYIINDYGESINAQSLGLISTEGLIFGTYGRKENDRDILNDTAITLLTLDGFYKSKGLIPETSIIYELPNNNLVIRGERLFEYSSENIPVYLWVLSKQTEILGDRLEMIKKELFPLVKLFM